MNINQQMIRPLLQNVTILILFLHADGHDADLLGGEAVGHDRAAADLAAHRLPDHHGQVPRRDGAVRRDAGGHADPHRRCCSSTASRSGSRSSPPISACCCWAAASSRSGLFISSLTKNQIVAGMVTFAVFLLLWVITWIGSFSGPTVDEADAVSVDHRPLRRLRQRRHRHDAPHLLLSFITFGLFLTAKSVDSERWRG